MFHLTSSLQQLYEANTNSILQVGKLKIGCQQLTYDHTSEYENQTQVDKSIP